MEAWKKLSDDELFFILRCEKLRHIVDKFSNRFTLDNWLEDAREHYEADFGTSLISQSIFSSLNDAPSYSLMTLLAIIGTVSIKVFALSILTAGFSTIMLLTGVIFFIASYQEQRDEMKKARKFFDFATIKIQCAKELIRRQEIQLGNMHVQPQLKTFEPDIHLKPFVYKNSGKLQKIKPALGAGLLTATMLFGTYYLGVSAIIAAFGAAAAATALLGPIGLGVALGAAALLGIYCGYKQYRSSVIADKIDKQQKHLGEEFRHQRDKCYGLSKRISSLQNDSTLMHRSYSDPDFSCKKDLIGASSKQHDFLMRRANLYRHKRTLRPPAADPIIPSPANNNNFPSSGRPIPAHFKP